MHAVEGEYGRLDVREFYLYSASKVRLGFAQQSTIWLGASLTTLSTCSPNHSMRCGAEIGDLRYGLARQGSDASDESFRSLHDDADSANSRDNYEDCCSPSIQRAPYLLSHVLWLRLA